jgi:uncharacterized protein (DUF58 family)
LLLFALGLLLLATLLLPDRVWNTLLIGLSGLGVVAYLWARQLAAGLSASRRLRFGWVSVGDRLEEEFILRNHARLPALWVEVVDESTVPGYHASVVRSAGSGELVRWRQAAVCQQRGQYHLGPWSIRSGDPFGIFLVTRHYPAQQEIIIHPPIHGRLPIPLPAGQNEGRARTPQRAWRATINAATLREYQVDDPYRWIHWPTSARKDALYVRRFERDAAGDIWLLLDCDATVQLGEGADGSEEHAVLLAAALATHALQQNRAVGLATYGKQPQVVPPATGQGQQWRILRALALSDARGTTPLARAMDDLGQVARRGAAAVIITSSETAEWLPHLLTLSRQGVDGEVVLLDRQSFGGTDNAEGVCSAIRRLGYHCTIIRQGELGQPLEEALRRGFWEFKVTGLGKVIAVRSPVEK